MFIDLRERKKERKRNTHIDVREKHHWMPLIRTQNRNQTRKVGMCPDQESNCDLLV